MRLDSSLSSQRLWSIARQTERLDHDTLYEIVDHPNTYRELTDWATNALGKTDLSTLSAPPAPPIQTAAKRSLRLPSLPRPARHSKPTPAPAAAPAAGADAWLAAAPTPDPTPVASAAASRGINQWLSAPAPMGVVVVLVVLQLLTLLALGVVASKPAPAPVVPEVSTTGPADTPTTPDSEEVSQ